MGTASATNMCQPPSCRERRLPLPAAMPLVPRQPPGWQQMPGWQQGPQLRVQKRQLQLLLTALGWVLGRATLMRLHWCW